jgi:hypothetical protein
MHIVTGNRRHTDNHIGKCGEVYMIYLGSVFLFL